MSWINLREEPVIYINENPYVLRSIRDQFDNLHYPGITNTRVLEMSNRLKNDVIREAKYYHNKLLVYQEESTHSLTSSWEDTHVGSIQTLNDVFDMIHNDGYRVRYFSIPISTFDLPSPSVCFYSFPPSWFIK